jgi:hypothetical protein
MLLKIGLFALAFSATLVVAEDNKVDIALYYQSYDCSDGPDQTFRCLDVGPGYCCTESAEVHSVKFTNERGDVLYINVGDLTRNSCTFLANRYPKGHAYDRKNIDGTYQDCGAVCGSGYDQCLTCEDAKIYGARWDWDKASRMTKMPEEVRRDRAIQKGNVKPNAAVFVDLKGEKHYFKINYDVPESVTEAFRKAMMNGTTYETLDPTLKAMEVKREDISPAKPDEKA